MERRIAVAHGDEPADLLLRGGRLVNVVSGEIETVELAVADGEVAAIGSGYDAHEIIELSGALFAPAFIDAHIHLESSMATPPQFARAIVPRGTGTVIIDPHEIANVMGLAGVRYILAATEKLPLGVFVMAPSCVPATHLETAGADFGPDEISALLAEPRVLGLAEMMNFPGVIHRAPDVLRLLELAEGKPRDGHAPGLAGRDLAAYAAAGIGSDHECMSTEEAMAKLSLGMHIMVREGSSAKNMSALLGAVTERNSSRFLLCTDDKTPSDLVEGGHVDQLLRRAIAGGIDPVVAVQMATVNTANYFGLADRGALIPGRRADIVVFDDFESLKVSRVFNAGHLVAQGGSLISEPEVSVPDPVGSQRIENLPDAPFRIADSGAAKVRVIVASPDQLWTDAALEAPLRKDGELVSDTARDMLKLAVVERHRGTGNVGLGFIRGFGLKRGALATTVGHDSHNLLILGADDRAMAVALAAIRNLGGGKIVVGDDGVIASLPLPVAGLMSPAPIEETAAGMRSLADAARSLGCELPEPFMTLSFMALPVIPKLKLSDRGLVDVDRFEFVDLEVAD